MSGVHVRPAGASDLGPAFAVRDALAVDWHGQSEISIEHLRAVWGHGRAWVATADADAVVGYATNEDGYVEVWAPARPASAAPLLLDTIEATAPAPLETFVPAEAEHLVALFRERGWRRVREILRMEIDVSAAAASPAWPDGIGVRTYAESDAVAVHALLVEAFAGSAERVPEFARWHEWMTGDPSFDPGSWYLVEAGDELAGVCLCWVEGWVKDLAVRPAWRGRGLGAVLLRHAFAEFGRRGVGSVALKVDADNPTGAVRLYERVGMTRDRRYVMFEAGAPKGV